MADNVQKIREEVVRRMKAASKIEEDYKDIDEKLSNKAQLKAIEYHSMLMFIDSLQEEQVDYDKLKTSLDDALSKETKESWEKFLQEEQVSEDLEEAAIQFATDTETGKVDVVKQGSFFWGAKWKEQQFEKNRLKHCDTITNEQVELEQGFIDQHLDKYNRMPTFLDAIEYGLEYGKQQLMKSAKSGVVCDGNDYIKFDDGTWIELDPCMQLKPSFKLKDGDRVKVIVLKED